MNSFHCQHRNGGHGGCMPPQFMGNPGMMDMMSQLLQVIQQLSSHQQMPQPRPQNQQPRPQQQFPRPQQQQIPGAQQQVQQPQPQQQQARPDALTQEKNFTDNMISNFGRYDLDHDGFLNAGEVRAAGQGSDNGSAAETFITGMGTENVKNVGLLGLLKNPNWGKGMIFGHIEKTREANEGVSIQDLYAVQGKQRQGKYYSQIANEKF